MTEAARVSLNQQIEAVSFACTRQQTLANGGTVKGMRGKSAEQFDLARLQAAFRTLKWLEANEAEIRAALEERKMRQALKVNPEGGV